MKIGIDNKLDFLKWINNHYDKESLKKSFKKNTFLDAIINFFLRRE